MPRPPERDDPQADLEAAKRRLFPNGVPDEEGFKLRLANLPDVLAYPTPDEAAARFHRFLNPASTTTPDSAAAAMRAWFDDCTRDLAQRAAELPPMADDLPDPEVVAYVYPGDGTPSVRLALHGVDPLIYAVGPWLATKGPLPVRIEVGGKVLEGELHAACRCGAPREGQHGDDCDGYQPAGWFPGNAGTFDEDTAACALCGCTEDRACFPTCWWVQADPNLCNRCAERAGGVEQANALIAMREAAHTCPRGCGAPLAVDEDCARCGYPGPLAGELADDEVVPCPDGDGAGDARTLDMGHDEGPEVIYRWDDQARAVVVELDGEPCGALRLRPELLHQVPPDMDDLIARLRRCNDQQAMKREADLVVLAISLAVHAHDEDTAAALRAFPGVASMLDDVAPIGPGWGTTREGVRRRGALGRTPEPTE